MAIYSPDFNVNSYELRNEINEFLNSTQTGNVLDVSQRVPQQLDWLAQLLGWSGDNYWNSFNATVDQKRQLLTGSFGVYKGFIYPEIVEIRNWDNSVVIKDNPYIKEGQIFYLGDYDYTPTRIDSDGLNLVLKFESLSAQFFADIEQNLQLKTIAPSAIPCPFVRPDVKASGDRTFTCSVKDGAITLYPGFDSKCQLPYIFNTFFSGSRYYFNLPVKLIISEDYSIAPIYNFDSENWYLDIPCELTEPNVSLTGRLDYEGSFLIVSIAQWVDPSDWVSKDNSSLFKGVWGNKGGKLPFHFAFDALSLHGFDEKKSLYLPVVERSIDFDQLLSYVYQQEVSIDSTPPAIREGYQVWWNSQSGIFSLHLEDVFNCGPWVEREYAFNHDQDVTPDYVFPDVESFRGYAEDFIEGAIVQILDCSGLDHSDGILGLVFTSPLVSPGQVIISMFDNEAGWIPFEFVYTDVTSFETDANKLPPFVRTTILNADGLSENGVSYQIGNLKTEIQGEYKVVVMKHGANGLWFLSPPSELRYIGNTRLFQSSKDYGNPVEGETVWDFGNSDVNTRAASVFYYNRWEFNNVKDEWELKGDWINLNGQLSSNPPDETVRFSSILVYCDGNLLESGVSFLSEGYQITYAINEMTGEFNFSYFPYSYHRMVDFPRITISDSITTSYTFDITDTLFSGLTYYMSPNVKDSETLLRVVKLDNLFCVDDLNPSTKLSYPNALVADLNSGPMSLSWERYFIRLPPSYQRDGASWQKVNLICQDFGYWGSPALPEDMVCPETSPKPEVYEDVVALKQGVSPYSYVYVEPYLYSTVVSEYGTSDDYDNSGILPTFDNPDDTFNEAELIPYDPLHERRADVSSPVGKGYGEWDGEYYRMGECSNLSGYSVNDIVKEVLEPLAPPVWDSSLYKLPQTCILNKESGQVDANHFKIGYAFFAADLSSAGEAVFEFSK